MPGQFDRQSQSINLDRDFPQIAEISGVVEIYPSFGGPQREVRPFTKSNLPGGLVPCNSSVCNNGGVALGDMFRELLSEMVRSKQTEGKKSKFCYGYENMGRGQRRDCKTTLVRIAVQIKYKELETEKVE